MNPVEVWGGVSSAVARAHDIGRERRAWAGFADPLDELTALHDLGLRTIRLPCLWDQRVNASGHVDWSTLDARLRRMRALGLTPIAALVDQGRDASGRNLLEGGGLTGLTDYARAFAARCPWVAYYSPVDQPNTAAHRFGAEAGESPPTRDERRYIRALIIQCRAIVEAMRVIRELNPLARLVHTDDVGATFSTPALAHTAMFENERRWLGWDLLFGRVTRRHPLWSFLRDAGTPADVLDGLADAPCPPDVVSLSYDLSSDRFLEARVSPDSREAHPSDGPFTDSEAARARPEGIAGHEQLLCDAWARYGTPVVMTDGRGEGTREDRLRWLTEAWRATVRARDRGVSVKALCVWTLLGSYDEQAAGVAGLGARYRAGAFDIRSSPPRPTALAAAVRALAAGHDPTHPVLQTLGWWRRPDRLAPAPGHTVARGHGLEQPLLVTGGRGVLATALDRRCRERGLRAVRVDRRAVDIADAASVDAALDRYRPWAVVNAAGFSRVDLAESAATQVWRENVEGVATLCRALAARGIPLVTFSTDLVFDGALGRPCLETDPPAPLSVYGRSKAEAERVAQNSGAVVLIVRTSACFAPSDTESFVGAGLARLRQGLEWRAPGDVIVSPTYVPHLVEATIDLLIDGERGLWHLTSAGEISWYDLASEVADRAGFDRGHVERCQLEELGWPAPRPLYSALDSMRGRLLPMLDEALRDYLAVETSGPTLAERPPGTGADRGAPSPDAKPAVQTASRRDGRK